MARSIPWASIKELVQLLELQQAGLTEQIAALRATQDPQTEAGRATILLCEYLVGGSAKKAVIWAKSMGWKIASSNRGVPSQIDYTTTHIYRFIDNPTVGISPALAQLCCKVLSREREKDWGD